MVCGEMALSFLGGHDGHWQTVLVGDCLREMDSLSDWPAGAVAVTKDMHVRLTSKDANAGGGDVLMAVTVAPAPAAKVSGGISLWAVCGYPYIRIYHLRCALLRPLSSL